MSDAIIHLRVPAATKARWVRKSRAYGLRLTDWIVQAVEARHPDWFPQNNFKRLNIGATIMTKNEFDHASSQACGKMISLDAETRDDGYTMAGDLIEWANSQTVNAKMYVSEISALAAMRARLRHE